MKKNKGNNLYRSAKTIIPGGTMLYSKRAELHSPDFWPSYYKKSKIVIFGLLMERSIWT